MAVNYFNRLEPAQQVQRQCEDAGVKAVVIKAVRCLFLFALGLRLWLGVGGRQKIARDGYGLGEWRWD